MGVLKNIDLKTEKSSLTPYISDLYIRSINSRKIIVWFRDDTVFDTSKYFWCNEHMADKLGIDRDENGLVLNKDYYNSFVLDEEGMKMVDKLKEASKAVRDQNINRSQYTVKLKNHSTNEVFYIDFLLEVFERDSSGKIISWGGNGIDISKSYIEAKKAKYMANHDSNTGIHNRRHLFKTIHTLWNECLRNKKPLSLIMLDVDDFKLYNDTFGHVQGDYVLKKIANELANFTRRPLDGFGRYGGEEFMVILPNTDVSGAYQVAEELRKRIIDLNILHSEQSNNEIVTISLGISSLVPTESLHVESHIHNADIAMFTAKSKGKNRTEVFKYEKKSR